MSLYDYKYGMKLSTYDPPFYALLFAMIREADSINTAKIKAMWPEVYAESERRYYSQYHPETGVLPEDGIPPDKPLPKISLER